MNKKEILHGQALSMQWVGYALNKISTDINAGGDISKQLLDSVKSLDKIEGLKALSIGCNYVINFLLPFTLELSLKALLAKEGIEPNPKHNFLIHYNRFSGKMKQRLQNEYSNQCKLGGCHETGSLVQLLTVHQNDFVDWRYLENAEKLKREEKEMHIAIYTILEIYSSRE